MDWLQGLNQAMDYVEQNLEGELDIAAAARLACCSTYQFTRMFSYMAGVPLSEYVRRRRLSKAAAVLSSGGAKVVDVALRFGYDSPTAFHRAFKVLHGVAPSEAKHPGVRLKSFPPIRFQLSIKGDVEMEYKIEQRPGFTLLGEKHWVRYANGKNFSAIPKFWDELDEKTCKDLLQFSTGESPALLGACVNMNDEGFDYLIAVEGEGENRGRFDAVPVPAATWAIFEAVGPLPDSIQGVTKRIFSDWFPTSGYQRAGSDVPDLEVYPMGKKTSDADYRCEVWVPVVKEP